MPHPLAVNSPRAAARVAPDPGGCPAIRSEESLPRIDEPLQVAPADARELSRLFLIRLRASEEGTREYQYARNTLIEMNISLVRYAVGPFRAQANGCVEIEDLIQVGTIGLIKAVDRFDPGRHVEFSTLALPYITGEIKRYFRDTTWAAHVPRRLQELRAELARSQEALTEALGRAPAVREVAEYLRLSEREVIEGLLAANAYNSASLDTAGDTEERSAAGTDSRPPPTRSATSIPPWTVSRTSTPSPPSCASSANATDGSCGCALPRR